MRGYCPACAPRAAAIFLFRKFTDDYPRWRNGRLQHWLVNMGGEPGTFTLVRPARTLLVKDDVHSAGGSHRDHPGITLTAGVHTLGAYDYLVLEDIKEEHSL